MRKSYKQIKNLSPKKKKKEIIKEFRWTTHKWTKYSLKKLKIFKSKQIKR